MKPMAIAASVSGIVGCSGESLAAWTYYTTPDGPAPLGPAELTFQDEASVRAFRGGVCVKNFIDESGKDWLNKDHQVDRNEWKTLKDTFTWKLHGKANGCMAISWIKETWKDGYYKAMIRYEWVFTVGNESLVSYGLYNPDKSFNDILWKTAYVNRENKRIAWLVRYVKREDAPLKPNTPKGKDEYWGFNPKLPWNKRCVDTIGCVDEPLWKNEGEVKWTWQEDEKGQQRFDEWTKNFWPSNVHLIDNDSHNLTKFRAVVHVRKGTWTQR